MRVILLISTLLIPSTCLAQEMSRSDYEAFCDAMLGRWVGEMTPVAQGDAFGEAGKTITGYASSRMTEDGNALLCKVYGGEGTGTWLIAHDARAKQIRTMWINSAGDVDQALILRDGADWIERGEGSTEDGKVIVFENRLTISDGGKTHTWTGKSSRGGEPNAPRHDVWRRVDGRVPVAEGSEEFQEFAEMIKGRWKGDIVYIHDWEGEEIGKGGKVTGYAEFRVTADGHAIIEDHIGGTSEGTNIYVWDRSLGRIIGRGFGSAGMSIRVMLSRASDKSWDFIPVAGSDVRGKPLGGTATLTFSEDGESYRWSGTLTLGGEPLAPLEDVYHRVH